MKKVLSLVLVIAMVLSSMSFAFAGTFEDVTGDYENAVEALVALGVVKGYEDGTFRPERTITRAELAKILVEALGYGKLVAGAANSFSDTQGHWASGYVSIAAGTGLVVGYPNGTFLPDKTVTYDEAYTMVLRALGYADEALKGTWPTNFKIKAIDLGLDDDVVMAKADADRGGVAQILYNALELEIMELGEEKVLEGTGRMLIDNIASPATIKVDVNTLDPDHDDYRGDIVDLSAYMYEEIEAYVNDDKDVVYVKESNSDTVKGIFEKDDASMRVGIDVDKADNEYDIVYTVNTDTDDAYEAVKVYYNGLEVAMTEGQMEDKNATFEYLKGADVKAVLNKSDDIVALVANKATEVQQATKAYNGKSIVFANIELPLDKGDVDFDKLTVTGEVTDLTDVEKDDILVVYAAGGYKTIDTDEELTIVVVRDTVEGKVTRKNADGDFNIDGTYYSVSELALDTIEVGNEGTFYLDNAGEIVAFDEDDSSDPADYAVVTKVLDGVAYPDSTDDEILLRDPQVTLVNAKGEKVTYKVDRDTEDTDLFAADDDLDVVLEAYAIVKYKVEDGLLTEVSDVTPVSTTEPTSETDTTKSTFVLADNVLVFNFVDNTTDSKDKVEVVDAADLGDKVKVLHEIENSNGEIEVLFVYGTGVSKATYAYVVDDAVVLDKDDEKVQEIIAYVDGVEVAYETNALGKVTSTAIDAGKLFELTFEDGIVTVAEDVTAEAVVSDQVTKVSDNRFRVGTGTSSDPYVWYTLADDVVVYVLDDGEFNYVGDESSVYDEANIVGYSFDSDNVTDKVIEILFIFE